MADRKNPMGSGSDEPPNSRLFIVGSKTLKEDDYRNAFEKFGTIEEIWVVKDRNTGDNKGVTYIKFSKTSEAASALESMNGKNIGKVNRSIKVMIAASREQGSKREMNEEEKTLRLFVVVPKTMTDSELYDEFKVYGDIDYASIIKDRETKESKGFAYVKYFRFSHAAKAFEECDRKYKPVFAEPRKPQRDDRSFIPPPEPFVKSTSNISLPVHDYHTPDVGYTKLTVIASPVLNQDQLWKLFDIVPGLDYCQVSYEGRPRPTRAIAEVVYTSHQSAAHAKEKLHGFEYPIGYRLIIKPEYDSRGFAMNKHIEKPKPDILQIAETIAQAVQAVGMSPDLLQAKLGLPNPHNEIDAHCNIKLPPVQPLAHVDDEAAARCFVVCTPNPLPNAVLRDLFSRFGNLIDAYMLNNRNCGYAKYASKKSAEDAIKVLHGVDVMGVRLKVMEAEDKPSDPQRKRQRIESPF